MIDGFWGVSPHEMSKFIIILNISPSFEQTKIIYTKTKKRER